MDNQTILVTGVTGRQGGATARHLLGQGWRVRGLTRNPESPAARQLSLAGVEMVQGDLRNLDSLRRAMRGVYGVFSVQNYWEKGVGYEDEVRQGKNVATAAKAANVQHFVQTSIASVDQAPKCLHWNSKHAIEGFVRECGLPFTMLRTVFYMDNFIDPNYGPAIMLRALLGCLESNTELHMIATDDIGALAVHVFNHPEEFIGRHWDVAGDVLTKHQIAQTYTSVTGKPVPKLTIPIFMMKLMNREMGNQLEANNRGIWSFPIEPIRSVFPELHTWEAFCKKYVSNWSK